MKKHRHKYKWIEAKIYGTKHRIGMVEICNCGKMKSAIKETGFAQVTRYEVCDKGELHQVIP